MALVLADRVRDTTTTTGTGTVTLSGTAPTGYQNFSVVGDGNTTYYTINAASQWEVGIGTYSSTGPTLSRTTVLASSNGGALVDFAAGTKDVFVTYPAEKSVNYDDNGQVVLGIGGPSDNALLDVEGNIYAASAIRAGGGIDLPSGFGNYWRASLPSGAYQGGIVYNGGLRFYSGDVVNERMRIDSSGNVGIGTSSPGSKLQVNAASTGTAFIVSSSGVGVQALGAYLGSGVAYWADSGALNGMGVSTASNYVNFLTNNTERMRLTAAGRLGIGVTSPAEILDVKGQVNVTNPSNISFNAIRGSSFGYSAGYNALVVGATSGNTTVCINVDPIANTSPTFSGTGGEVMFRNNVNFITPNSANTSFLSVMTMSDGNVGIGTSSPVGRLTLQGAAGTNGINQGLGLLYSNGTQFGALGLNNSTGWPQLMARAGAGLTFHVNSDLLTTGEAMRITTDGNVGIGTSSPGSKLHVNGSGFFSGSNSITGTGVNIEYIGGGAINCKNFTAGTWDILDYGASTHSFYINGSGPAMRIDSSSKVGIGTSSPSAKLHISGSSVGNSNIRLTNILAPRSWEFNPYTTGDSDSKFAIRDVTAAADRIAIDSSGNVGIGTSSPNNKLDVNGSVNIGAALLTGTGVSTGDAQIELGGNRTGNGNAYIDWHATAGTDLESRIIRYGGTNGGMDIINMGTGGMVISQEGAAPMVFKTTATERMRIDSSGNVGVGTSSPGVRLDVAGGDIRVANARNLSFRNAAGTSQARYILQGDDNFVVYNAVDAPIMSFGQGASPLAAYGANANNRMVVDAGSPNINWVVNGSERARINSSGDVLVNTTTTFGKLSVYGTTGFNADANAAISGSGSFKFRGTAAGTTITTYDYLNYTAVQFIRDNGNPTNTVGSITCTDTATTYNTSSDRRLKKDITPAGDAGSVIDAIEIVSHGWKASEGTVPFGVIAQDLHAIAPQAVHAGDTGEEVTDVWGVDYSKLVPMLIKEVQSLRARVAQLEGK